MPTSEHIRPSFALSDLTERLRRHAPKVTGQRQAILEILRQHRLPLTSKDIFAALPRGDCDLATVYRSLRLLERAGMVKRFEFGDGVARYELLAEGEDGHHHHLICTTCARIVELEVCFGEELEARIANSSGFRGVTHRLEFFGVCPSCQ
jgi:Fe2+ or Zn2+ uptake regulation protein